jgi:CheY-like chemotaxis protein
VARERLLATVAKWADVRPVILAVDDAADNRALVRRYLLGGRFRLVEATSGDDAIKRFAEGRVSLVLLDLRMPGRSGADTALALRALPGGLDVPIVAFTASDGGGEEERAAREAGFDAFLTKPVSRERLVEALVRALKLPHQDALSLRTGEVPVGDTVVVDDDVADLVPQYLHSRRRDAVRLRSLVAWSDFDATRTLGHNIKGSGVGYGFPELSQMGHEIELAGSRKDSDRLLRLANQLERYARNVKWTRGSPE